jgi:hypothetical protein
MPKKTLNEIKPQRKLIWIPKGISALQRISQDYFIKKENKTKQK